MSVRKFNGQQSKVTFHLTGPAGRKELVLAGLNGKKQATGTRAHSRLQNKTIAIGIAISTVSVSVSGFSLFRRGRAVCS